MLFISAIIKSYQVDFIIAIKAYSQAIKAYSHMKHD